MQAITDLFKPEKVHLLYIVWDSIGTCLQGRLVSRSSKDSSDYEHVSPNLRQRVVGNFGKGCCVVGEATMQEYQVCLDTRMPGGIGHTKGKISDCIDPYIFRLDQDIPHTCGASSIALGTMLAQPGEDKIDHPVYFVGRKLSNSKKNYTTKECEGLAMVYAL